MSSPTFPKVTLRMLISFLVVSLVFAFFPLLVVGRWDWWQGWAFGLVMLLNSILSRVLVAQRHPDLLAERGKAMDHPDAKEWDKKLAPLAATLGPIVTRFIDNYDTGINQAD